MLYYDVPHNGIVHCASLLASSQVELTVSILHCILTSCFSFWSSKLHVETRSFCWIVQCQSTM